MSGAASSVASKYSSIRLGSAIRQDLAVNKLFRAIIELNGLVGNIAIPKQTSTVTTYWLAEGAAVTGRHRAI